MRTVFACAVAIILALLLVGATHAHAATINVTANATDTLNGTDGQCSLREAIANINNGAATYADCPYTGTYGTGDTVNIPAGTYTTASTTYTISKNISIAGAGAGTTIIDGNGLGRVFYIADGPYAVAISGVTIQHGSGENYGGGIAIWSGTLTVANSSISGNTAGVEGGAIYNWFATLTVTNSTISSNSAYGGWGGGGIFNVGPATISNCTFTGNTAANGRAGGGIFQGGSGGALVVINSTFSGNAAATGGGIHTNGDSVTLSNSIVASQAGGADCSGSITSAGHNLESGTSCGFTGTGDLQNTAPLLGALASNGGPTQTMALQDGSPAINAGDNAICAATPVNGVDQRGYIRPAGANCDIGAFEYGALNTTPDAFSFTAQTQMPLNTRIVSNPITVTGINSDTPISISGNSGEFKINSDSWTSSSGTVASGDIVMVRQTSSSSNSTLTTTTLNIGGVTANFNVTTAASGDPNASGLISWWKGDGNPYDSVSGNSGALQSGTTYVAGHDGQAFSFNGTTDFVQVLNPQNIPVGNSPRTITAWVKSSGGTNLYQGIVGYGTPPNPGQVLFFEWGGNDDDLNRLYTMNLSGGARGATILAYDTWYHVALTHDGSNTKLYVNGQLDANKAMTQNTVMNGAGLRIGLSPDFDGWHRYFKGLVDDVRIYGRSLSDSEVSKLAGTYPGAFSFTSQTGMPLNTVIVSNPVTVTGISSSIPVSISGNGGEYKINSGSWTSSGTVVNGDTVMVRQTSSSSNATLTTTTLNIGGVTADFNVTTAASGDPNSNGLIGWWKADNNGYDSVGGNHGTVGGTVTYPTGKAGQAFSFPGGANYVNVPDSLPLRLSTAFTIESWVNPSSVDGTGNAIVSKFGATSWKGYQTGLSNMSGQNVFFCSFNADGEGWPANSTYGGHAPLNEWSHVACTYDGDKLKVFVNGIEVNSTTVGAKTVAATDIALRISGDLGFGSVWFNGLVDEVKIYNRALSADEVSKAAGTYPNAFAFTPQTGVALSTVSESNAITVTGITNPASISITGGEYSVSTDNGVTWTLFSSSAPSTVQPSARVKVRLTSSGSYNTPTTATLTIGGVSAGFSVTTAPDLVLNPVTSPTNQISQTITGTVKAGAAVTVSLNSGTVLPATVAGSNWSYTVTGLHRDGNQITVTATDTGYAPTKSATINCIAPQLTVTVTGTGDVNGMGGGTVTSTPAAIACTAGPCSALFDGLLPVTLIPTPDSDSLFSGWSGACTATSGNCDITMPADMNAGDQSAGATFAYVLPAQIQQTGVKYPQISDAYAALTGDGAILARQFLFTNSLNLDKPLELILKGGYDTAYAVNSGYSTIQGQLVVGRGSLTVERVIVR